MPDVPDVTALVDPAIAGRPEVGRTLHATTGTWDTAGLTFAFQWLRDGADIGGATGSSYRTGRDDVGSRLAVRVTATKPEATDGTATSAGTEPVRKASARIRLGARTGSGRQVRVRIAVRSPSTHVEGRVVLRVDGRTVRKAQVSGKPVKLRIRLHRDTTHRLRAIFRGSPTVESARSKSVRVHRR
ncbi:hypothetical protein BH09ACT12_BH09ACT12_24660 [soil metagenome]